MAHDRTFHITHLGPFLTVDEVEALSANPNEAEKIESLFQRGRLLTMDERSEILDGIDLVFKSKLMKDGALLPRFGTMDKDFVHAMAQYKADVLNYLQGWERRYAEAHSPTGLNLQARAAYALRPAKEGLAPRPLLTVAFIQALDYLFQQIPSVVIEVSTIFYFISLFQAAYSRVRVCCIYVAMQAASTCATYRLHSDVHHYVVYMAFSSAFESSQRSYRPHSPARHYAALLIQLKAA